MFHEVLGHLGVKAALGGQTSEALDGLWYRLNGLAGVAKLAKKHEAAPGVTVWQRLQPYIKGTEGADPTHRRAVIMDELIAYLAQANDTAALTQFKGYLADLKAAVVKLLRRFGLATLAEKLDQAGAELDALALVRDARASIVTGKTRDGQQFVFVSQGQALNPAFSNKAQLSVQADGKADQGKAEVLQGEPVATLNGDEAPRTGMAAVRAWATELFKQQGGMARNPDIGDVLLDARSVRHSMAHGGPNPFKYAAFAAVKDVLEKGVVVLAAQHGRDATSYYVSAPVRIKGEDDVVTVLVRRDPNDQRMYLHSVATKKYLLNRRVSGTDTAGGVERSGSSNSGDGGIVAQGQENGKLAGDAVANELNRLLTIPLDSNTSALFSAQGQGFALPEFGRASRFIEAIQNRYNRWKQAIDGQYPRGVAESACRLEEGAGHNTQGDGSD